MEVLINGGYREINLNSDYYLGSGITGNVYKISNKLCLKYYKNADDPKDIEPLMIKLKNLRFYNISNIRELLYDVNNFKYIGYLMDYIESSDINIFDMNTEYLLDSFYNLLNDAYNLSKNNILIYDLHPGNSRLTKDGIKTFDMDFYKIVDYDPRIENNDSIRLLFYLLLKKLYEKNHTIFRTYTVFDYRLKKLLDYHFKNNKDYNTDTFYHVLKKYKKPIDYFRG